MDLNEGDEKMIIGITGNYNYKGIPLTSAFARIDTVSSYDTHCTVNVNIYASKESYDQGAGFLDTIYPIGFEKVIGNTVGDDRTQAYGSLKTDERFKEWIIVEE